MCILQHELRTQLFHVVNALILPSRLREFRLRSLLQPVLTTASHAALIRYHRASLVLAARLLQHERSSAL